MQRFVIRRHRFLLSSGSPTILLSYADLLWRTEETSTRILTFIPCMRHLDPTYVPTLGTDYVPSNHWKAHGSTAAYGAAHPPAEVGFSLRERRCTAPPPLEAGSAEELAAMVSDFNASQAYLSEWSELDWGVPDPGTAGSRGSSR
jgi:hypothetical protein